MAPRSLLRSALGSILSAGLLLAWAAAAQASPIGTIHRPFIDAPVTDGMGNEAGETHRTLAGIPFDELPDASVQNLILGAPAGSSFVDPPGPVFYDEAETPIAGGSRIDFWVMGDVSDATVPIFSNAVATDSAFTVLFGVENLYWAGAFASGGESAQLLAQAFSLGFGDGSSAALAPIMADTVFGAGTEDSPFVYFAEFEAADFAGTPTSLHVQLDFLHVPEPGATALVLLAIGAALGRRRRRERRPHLLPALAVGFVLLVPHPGSAGIPLAVDITDGYDFSGETLAFEVSGTALLPLGDLFAPVSTNIILSSFSSSRFDVRARFPGQGGQTVVVNDGDAIDFEIIAELLLFVEVIDVDPMADFGDGGGNVFSTLQAELQGTGVAIANTFLPNLGILSNLASLSLRLGAPGGGRLDVALDKDLNGDGTSEVTSYDSLVLTASGGGVADFAYPPQFTRTLDPRWRNDNAGRFLTVDGRVNPAFEMAFDVVEWTIEQDVRLPAETVPEPAPLVLVGLGALLLALGRRSPTI